MIIYNIADPTTEIKFNLSGVSYEYRRLPAPDTSYILGEWVGLGANFTAVKVLSTDHVLPAMVWTSTDRHDVTESEGVTVARGWFHLSTMNYKLGESFAIGDELMVGSDGGIGKLVKMAGGSATHFIVGSVRQPPAVDGTDRLIAEIFPAPQTIVVP
jgi:hypothetical protein